MDEFLPKRSSLVEVGQPMPEVMKPRQRFTEQPPFTSMLADLHLPDDFVKPGTDVHTVTAALIRAIVSRKPWFTLKSLPVIKDLRKLTNEKYWNSGITQIQDKARAYIESFDSLEAYINEYWSRGHEWYDNEGKRKSTNPFKTDSQPRTFAAYQTLHSQGKLLGLTEELEQHGMDLELRRERLPQNSFRVRRHISTS